MQDSTFHPGRCRIKYHQFQGIISCSISLLAHSSQKELEVELCRPCTARRSNSGGTTLFIHNHRIHLLVRHAISFCSHVSHSTLESACAPIASSKRMSISIISTSCLTSVGKGCSGCTIILARAHPEMFWYQMLFSSKTRSSLSSTLSFCNSKLPSNYLCLYLLLV